MTIEKQYLNILLVDDDEDEFVLLRNIVSSAGFTNEMPRYHLEWVSNYEAALQAFENMSHDVYLVDYRLGEQNGLDLLQELSARGSKAPVIVLTGFGTYEVDTAAMQAGADDFLVKDQLTPQLLERVIRYALEHKQVKEDLEQHVRERTRELEEANRQLKAEIAERRQAQEELRKAKDELELRVAERTSELRQVAMEADRRATELNTILDSMTELLFIYDSAGRLQRANPAAMRALNLDLVGMSGEEIIQALSIHFPDGRLLREEDLPSSQAINGIPVSGQLLKLTNARQEEITVMSSAAAFSDENGNISGVVAIWHDVTERERLHQELQHLAITDSLTGQYNRRGFFQMGEVEIDQFHRYYRPLSVIIIDLDHFKAINDTHGHSVGDQVLRTFAERCCREIRHVDLYGRLGGDEFAILLPETDIFEAAEIARRILQSISGTPISSSNGPIQVTVSIGVAMALKNTIRLEDLLRRADEALYTAKQKGRGRVEIGY